MIVPVPKLAPKPDQLAQINNLVRNRHPAPEWLFLNEVRTRSGWSTTYGKDLDSERYIDAFAINTFPSSKFKRVAYEYKVNRSDWLSELDDPVKKAQAYFLSNAFYFVMPEAIFDKKDLICNGRLKGIDGCGVLLLMADGTLRKAQPATPRQAFPMPEAFIASLLRNAVGMSK